MLLVDTQLVDRSRSRLSVPGPGIVLSSETEKRAIHLRRAVQSLEPFLTGESVRKSYSEMFSPRVLADHHSAIEESLPQLAAWALIGIYICARCSGEIDERATVLDAEVWFLGAYPGTRLSSFLSEECVQNFHSILSKVDFDDDFRDLLPYVLESHGLGTRLSVMRDPATRTARANKRAGGVFYTPADVAEFITNRALGDHGAPLEMISVLDPACGTGVFLRAALRLIRQECPSVDIFEYAMKHLFGTDISLIALQSACFVVLHDCMEAVSSRKHFSPWQMWHLLRANLYGVDALLLTPGGSRSTSSATRASVIREIQDGYPHHSAAEADATIENIFPDVLGGFDVVVGNPPYATIGERADIGTLCRRFSSITKSTADNLYPLFVELMWKLANPSRHAAGLVVPLSLAFQKGKQITACREAMRNAGGRWDCAFFDREPHALFGEEVKTRNTILFHVRDVRDPSNEVASFTSTSLQKWNSANRRMLFDQIVFTPVGRLNIRHGIPKLRGHIQAESAKVLESHAGWFKEWPISTYSIPLRDTFALVGLPVLFVGSTAYNFINVFPPTERPHFDSDELSQNQLTALEFVDEATAHMALAVLSSRVTFWWWHVQCDGFHVPMWFLESLPFGKNDGSGNVAQLLGVLGAELWSSLHSSPIISNNAGRLSLAFRPSGVDSLRDEIDSLLIRSLGLPSSMGAELQRFMHEDVLVKKSNRNSLN